MAAALVRAPIDLLSGRAALRRPGNGALRGRSPGPDVTTRIRHNDRACGTDGPDVPLALAEHRADGRTGARPGSGPWPWRHGPKRPRGRRVRRAVGSQTPPRRGETHGWPAPTVPGRPGSEVGVPARVRGRGEQAAAPRPDCGRSCPRSTGRPSGPAMLPSSWRVGGCAVSGVDRHGVVTRRRRRAAPRRSSAGRIGGADRQAPTGRTRVDSA